MGNVEWGSSWLSLTRAVSEDRFQGKFDDRGFLWHHDVKT